MWIQYSLEDTMILFIYIHHTDFWSTEIAFKCIFYSSPEYIAIYSSHSPFMDKIWIWFKQLISFKSFHVPFFPFNTFRKIVLYVILCFILILCAISVFTLFYVGFNIYCC